MLPGFDPIMFFYGYNLQPQAQALEALKETSEDIITGIPQEWVEIFTELLNMCITHKDRHLDIRFSINIK